MALILAPIVNNEDALKTVLNGTARITRLASDIVITKDLYIAKGECIDFNGFRFIWKAGIVHFYGTIYSPSRIQYFQGFPKGNIQCSYGFGEIYPEWWGISNDEKDDVAINCAIFSCMRNAIGNVVSLASGRYMISDSIDLGASNSVLKGAGAGRTQVWASKNWAPTLELDSIWGKANHSAMVWMGGNSPGNQTFNTGIEGINFSAWYASIKDPSKRVSCISSKAWIEENSFIRNFGCTGFTGFGVGVCPNQNSQISTVNGLEIRNFWITGSMKRDCYPFYFSQHANVVDISCGTIDCTLNKATGVKYALENGDPVYPKPEFVREPTRVGIHASGKMRIDNIHFEGMTIGVHVVQGFGQNMIDISNVDGYCLYDENCAYAGDPANLKGPPPSLEEQAKMRIGQPAGSTPEYFYYSCMVMIGREIGEWSPKDNHKSFMTLRNVQSHGGCKYLLRDAVYGVEETAYGHGQFPNEENSCISFYSRGSAYAPATGVWPNLACPKTYNKAAPSTEKKYFVGPIR